MVHLTLVVSEKLLAKLKEELKSCQKELDVSKEISKKLTMEKNLLDQKVQRLERMKSEEVIPLLNCLNIFFSCSDFTVKTPLHISEILILFLCRKVQWKRFMGMNSVS